MHIGGKDCGLFPVLGIVMQLFNEQVYQETASFFNITSVMGQLPPLNFLIAMLSQLYGSNYWSIAPSAKYRLLNCSVPPFSLLSALFVALPRTLVEFSCPSTQ